MTVTRLQIELMNTPERCKSVESALSSIPGVVQVQTTLPDNAVEVRHDESVSLAALLNALRTLGYAKIAVLT